MGCFSNGCFGSWKHNKVSDKPPEEELHSSPAQQLLDRVKSEEDETTTVVKDMSGNIEEDETTTVVKDMNANIDHDVLLQNEPGEKGGELSRDNKEEDDCQVLIQNETEKKQETPDVDVAEEESYDSLFSLCIDFNNPDVGETEVSSPLKKPITKSRDDDTLAKCIMLDSNKENACPEMIDNETAVVACSLSSWLKSSSHNNSPESEKNYSLPPVKLKASFTVLTEI